LARLFALADLHLSLGTDKPMDVFGEAWRDHPRRMAAAWDALVATEDTVLLPGDLSWGRNPAQAAPDLEWIGHRPGRKLLLKGNHDSWWGGAARVREALPEGCEILHNDSHRIGDVVVVGARGWTSPGDPRATDNDARIFSRELERLQLSVRHADQNFGDELRRIGMVHFPPWVEGYEPTPVLYALRRAGVSTVVYGHLHGADHALAVRGEREGMQFCFVAADAVDFSPVEIPADGHGT
jgi:predicted phosphohydrolase